MIYQALGYRHRHRSWSMRGHWVRVSCGLRSWSAYGVVRDLAFESRISYWSIINQEEIFIV